MNKLKKTLSKKTESFFICHKFVTEQVLTLSPKSGILRIGKILNIYIMKKKIFFIAVALSAMAMMAFTSCSYVEEPLYDALYGVEQIPGPWTSSGYTIREVGWGEYEVCDVYTCKRYYLDSYTYYLHCLPEDVYPERCEPYYTPYRKEIHWRFYCRGRYPIVDVFTNGKYSGKGY